MTRQFNAQFHCPNCNTWQTQETMFGRWIRNNGRLDSSKGYCVTDQDYWIHKFKTYEDREFQLLMLVEIKTMGAELSQAQRDTLHIVNQFMRNRRQTPTKELKYQPPGYVNVTSILNRKQVIVRAYGMHILTFSHLGPDDSDWIKWDHKIVDSEMLTSILSFDLDPDTLRPIDLRNHHITKRDFQNSLGLEML